MTRWLAEWQARMSPVADLVCFPGAGAGPSAFRNWPGLLPAWTTVMACHLPGRESRIDEQPLEDMAAAADATAAEYLQRRSAARPLVLFGHSMGGALAVEVAARLANAGRTASALILAASAPTTGRTDVTFDQAALADLLVRYDPSNRAITADSELFATLAPVLTADIRMLRRHEPPVSPRSEPAWLLTGTDDTVVPARDAAGWRAHFSGPVRQQSLPGGHFFPFREGQAEVAALLTERLTEAADLP